MNDAAHWVALSVLISVSEAIPVDILRDAAQLHVGCIMLTTKINHENS